MSVSLGVISREEIRRVRIIIFVDSVVAIDALNWAVKSNKEKEVTNELSFTDHLSPVVMSSGEVFNSAFRVGGRGEGARAGENSQERYRTAEKKSERALTIS